MCLGCLRFLKLNDNEATVRVLKEAVLSFVQERRWERFHNPKDLAESICIEASELLELFQWRTAKEVRLLSKDLNIERISSELADVVIYCLAFANILQIDMADSVFEKLRENARRYPKSKYVGIAPYHLPPTAEKPKAKSGIFRS